MVGKLASGRGRPRWQWEAPHFQLEIHLQKVHFHPFSIFAMPAYPRASVGFNFHLRVAVTSIWRNKKGRATQRPTNQPSKKQGPNPTNSRHCGESRWLATPKRCRFVRSRDKPHGSGDRHRSFPGGILICLKILGALKILKIILVPEQMNFKEFLLGGPWL